MYTYNIFFGISTYHTGDIKPMIQKWTNSTEFKTNNVLNIIDIINIIHLFELNSVFQYYLTKKIVAILFMWNFLRILLVSQLELSSYEFPSSIIHVCKLK